MAVTKAPSKLMAKYGAKLQQAAVKHANDEVDYGWQQLPGGISNGVAQLQECGFGQVPAGKKNAGEYYFRAMGVVQDPEFVEVKGQMVRVRGQQTSIMEMVCETKSNDGKVTTLEEHVANIQNHMKKIEPSLDVTDLEAAAATLAAAKPYFRFSTRESKEVRNPDGSVKYEARVWESWHGTKDMGDWVPPDLQAGAVNEAGGDADNGTGGDEGQNENAGDDAAAAPEFNEFEDIDSLVAQANEQDEDAGNKLIGLAVAAGIDEDTARATNTWDELAEMIRANQGDQQPEPEPEPPAEYVPNKKDQVKFFPLDPKTKKPLKKAADAEVIAVYPKNKTADVKRLDTKAIVKGLKWDELTQG